MSEIREVIDDVKSKVGDKGFLLIVIGLLAIFLFMLWKQSGDDGSNSTYIVPTGYTSYPDAVTNANVIIDEVNRNTDYDTRLLMDLLEGNQESNNEQFGVIGDLINDNFESTNNYMKDGFENIQNGISGIQSDVDNMQTDITAIKGSTKTNTDLLNSIKKGTTIAGSVGSSSSSSYYEKTPYKGVSIVDGLKSIGVYNLGGVDVGKVSSRTALAEANGIKNYTGTAKQNTQLLNLLKQGKLKKA